MDKYEFEQAFFDLTKEKMIDSFSNCKFCPGRILAYFRIYEIESLEFISDSEFKSSKERLLSDIYANADLNMKQDIYNLIKY